MFYYFNIYFIIRIKMYYQCFYNAATIIIINNNTSLINIYSIISILFL